MRDCRIYLAGAWSEGSTLRLDERAAHYVAHVLRKKPGDELVLFNGSANECRARILAVRKADVEVVVGECRAVARESPLDAVLAQGVSRGERMDYAVQKAVELGVRRIVPLFTEHSVVRLDDERRARRVEHWQAVAISACEQCGRTRVPAVDGITELSAWLPTTEGVRLVLHPDGARRLSELPPPRGHVTLLVGPEGGLSGREVDQAVAAGFVPVCLGPRTLRTETAGVAALTALQVLWGDLG